MIPVKEVAIIKMLNSFQEMVRHRMGIKYSRSMRYAEMLLGYNLNQCIQLKHTYCNDDSVSTVQVISTIVVSSIDG